MKFVAKEDYKSVRLFLQNFLMLSKKNIHKINMEKEAVTLNGKIVKLEETVKKNDVIKINIILAKSKYKINDEIKITKEYEDDFLLVVSKPFGIKTHPNDKEVEDNTLLNYLIKDYIYLEPIHRLDTDTCGLVIFAKSPLIKSKLDYMLEKKYIKRFYSAIIKKYIKPQQIMTNIGRDRIEKNKMAVVSQGKQAITNILSCEKLNKDFYKVCISLETGRTHQIRVHLAHLNSSIVGDKLYSKDFYKFKNMYLGALKLEFNHPVTNKIILITSSLKNDFDKIIK
ncbi:MULTISPECIES: RluA family pseudouridine synthase [unclassified Gemella]|uniref:RluA family pseudouridine synthase n=1 Tax=unclassified Gemella TaxID=2624949 RepID=UPI001C04A479|nr:MULTISPECIES: RluA family pseudouridine synthase [unclassified Gemella]MBU0278098.1 RluA family pseudouridine synthase [Gemella sp. zg-1178]QWQ38376.1 RluA family pseudouridine synthase [Gemella sp. zg-570]